MAKPLPRIRMELDFMPSPAEDRPGLMIRDPFEFSDAVLIVPPPLVRALACFDGGHDEAGLREAIHEATGELRSGELGERLLEALDGAGFLENERFDEMRLASVREFESAAVREPCHAGSAYPDTGEELEAWMAENMGQPAGEAEAVAAIAAPHASPEGGWASYRAAYGALGGWARDKTFVILGTSHYGEPGLYGLTRKRFVTPWGAAQTELALVDELSRRAPASIRMEDYCHKIEHSIEFQIVFLQSLFGAGVRVAPILAGSFAEAMEAGRAPESDPAVAAFIDVLGDIRAREGSKLVFVLGVDMAHMGRRYGDDFAAEPNRGAMAEAGAGDRGRIDRLMAGDAQGFWAQVCEKQDELRWCGTAPFYTFLKSAPGVRGTLLEYQHWAIDPESVVTFGAMTFR
ncbi:MAG: AmmeMemoRadiSam system protein B [Candidatus Solibacter sp.]|nr:AmmeMemoRadiSam system protein B [Candidatus Solibacter sp.]